MKILLKEMDLQMIDHENVNYFEKKIHLLLRKKSYFLKKIFFSNLLIFSTFFSCQQHPKNESFKGSSLKIASHEDFTTVDPAKGGNLSDASMYKWLYEGLVRLDYQGRVAPAIAEKINVSTDIKTFIFSLRDSQWSDGTPLTSTDFVETWKRMLAPDFPSPNAYQLYLIKNAKAFKEGKVDFSEVGIKNPDSKKLIIELEHSTPYFLKLLATYFYAPASPVLRSAEQTNYQQALYNGPYILKEWKPHQSLIFEKNPHYWNVKSIIHDRLEIQVLDENIAYQMFEGKSIDWAGSPLSTLPQDAIPSLKNRGQLRVLQAAGTHWFRFNTEAPPFHNVQVRRAFGLALDRKAIVEHVTQGFQQAALGIVPPILKSNNNKHYIKDHDLPAAWEAFQKALEELNIDKDQFPTITLIYSQNERDRKIAQTVQQQWQKAFGITVKLENYEPKHFLEKVKQGQYQISTGSWFADFEDPINFLEIFKFKSNSTNRTKWENDRYISLLDSSNKELDPTKRIEILNEAEKILMDEMPVAPLFYSAFNYLHSPDTTTLYLSPLGILNFGERLYDTREIEH